MKRLITSILISIGSIGMGLAQQPYYNWRLGAGAGVTYYRGDLSYGINNNAVAWPVYQLSLGRTISPSLSLELNGSWGMLTATDQTRNWRGKLQVDNPNFNRGLNFETQIRSAGLVVQYRFNNGIFLSEYARFAPYVFAGAGITDFDVYSNLLDANGQTYYYWPDNTVRDLPEGDPAAQVIAPDGSFETKVSSSERGANYPTRVATIPFGAGLQVRLADRLSANLRAEARYAFTDYLDNASTNSNPHDMYFLGTLSLHYHFNLSKKKFKAPIVYVGYNQSPDTTTQKPAVPNTASQRAVTNPDGSPRTDLIVVDRIPADQKQTVDTLGALTVVTAPDTLPNRDVAAVNTPTNVDTRTTVAVKEDSIRNDATQDSRLYKSQFSIARQFERDTTTALERQRTTLLRQQEANASAIRQSEEELERLKVQLDNKQNERTARTDTQLNNAQLNTAQQPNTIQPNNEQPNAARQPNNNQPNNNQPNVTQQSNNEQPNAARQSNNNQPNNDQELNTLNSRVRELNNSVDRLRRENETYQRQTRQMDRAQAASDLALLGVGLNSMKGQKSSGSEQDKAIRAKLDSLTALVNTLNTQLTTAAKRTDTTATGNSNGVGNNFRLESPRKDSIPALYLPADSVRLVESLMAGTATLDDTAFDSLQNQLQLLRQSVDSLQSQLAVAENKPTSKVRAPYGTLVVYFPLNSAAISEDDKRRIGGLAERLRANPKSLVQIKGFTDNTGKAAYNLALSRRRAETIREYLITQSGASSERVVLNYYGQAKAAEQGKSPYDRRVELELYVEE